MSELVNLLSYGLKDSTVKSLLCIYKLLISYLISNFI